MSWILWYKPVIPAFEKLRPEEFCTQGHIGYIVRSYLKPQPKQKKAKSVTKTKPTNQLKQSTPPHRIPDAA